ncbi:MAG: TIGR03936 family radical SAM-associated protein [Clostridia bacterium]|nr:TIGR03936 family radical SAM-associated protein [Clostridia bacterium]
MADNTPINLRVKFKKVGNLQYISHLDLVRTMNKIIVRAGLPLWYTEGFNPKPKMVFAAPLSTGVESLCEYMDIRLTEKMDTELAKKLLNDNMTEEMQVVEAYYPTSKLTDLKWLSYTLTLNAFGASSELANACDEALGRDSIVVMKKTKTTDAEVDIRPMIRSASAALDGNAIRVSCVLSADSQSFLNPEYIVKYLRGAVGILKNENLLTESYSIFRESAYFENMDAYS